jgi:hypothetical protein
MIDTKLGEARFLDFLPDQTLPSATLLELTQDNTKAETARWLSGLEKRVAEAWVIPMSDLNCAQCRMLVGQRFGLPWLARPVAAFVARYPQAECDLYPGDLTVNAVIAWREFAGYAPEETAAMLALDFHWLRREANEDEWEGSILRHAVASLDEALHA